MVTLHEQQNHEQRNEEARVFEKCSRSWSLVRTLRSLRVEACQRPDCGDFRASSVVRDELSTSSKANNAYSRVCRELEVRGHSRGNARTRQEVDSGWSRTRSQRIQSRNLDTDSRISKAFWLSHTRRRIGAGILGSASRPLRRFCQWSGHPRR